MRIDARVRALVAEIGAFTAVTGAAFLLFFPHRSDYAGHYLAGLGGTLMALGAVLFLTGRPLRWGDVGLVGLAVLFGVATEATVFRVAIFDPVDFLNQSVGAVVAGWLMLDVGRRRCGITGLVLGLIILVLGFFFAFT